jgi:8-oxo-dGTP diphosphatase
MARRRAAGYTAQRMGFTYPYPRPSVTVDVVFVAVHETPRLLLIRRAHEPFADHWALPGGFLDMDEELASAARRELLEETAVKVRALAEVGVFGAPGRDPRGRTITVAYAALHVGEPPTARAGDDASGAEWWPLRRLPKLAFDHRLVVRRALEVLRERARHGDGLRGLLARSIDASGLAAVYDALGMSDARALARRVASKGAAKGAKR